ncbi:uncharacterized protein LOC132202081 isoform X2 [Neocloeon triangulifer]|uniref:uncharacterized protein LOC132202081 isoform X2 n=1 Tax=Neocloeon triangulifer TaxID=2078957 RepID=UPI00286EBB5E|nr:uncharacterized protein LOC132202081 isoform X2 [Neocloeon triangulifer]
MQTSKLRGRHRGAKISPPNERDNESKPKPGTAKPRQTSDASEIRNILEESFREKSSEKLSKRSSARPSREPTPEKLPARVTRSSSSLKLPNDTKKSQSKGTPKSKQSKKYSSSTEQSPPQKTVEIEVIENIKFIASKSLKDLETFEKTKEPEAPLVPDVSTKSVEPEDPTEAGKVSVNTKKENISMEVEDNIEAVSTSVTTAGWRSKFTGALKGILGFEKTTISALRTTKDGVTKEEISAGETSSMSKEKEGPESATGIVALDEKVKTDFDQRWKSIASKIPPNSKSVEANVRTISKSDLKEKRINLEHFQKRYDEAVKVRKAQLKTLVTKDGTLPTSRSSGERGEGLGKPEEGAQLPKKNNKDLQKKDTIESGSHAAENNGISIKIAQGKCILVPVANMDATKHILQKELKFSSDSSIKDDTCKTVVEKQDMASDVKGPCAHDKSVGESRPSSKSVTAAVFPPKQGGIARPNILRKSIPSASKMPAENKASAIDGKPAVIELVPDKLKGTETLGTTVEENRVSSASPEEIKPEVEGVDAKKEKETTQVEKDSSSAISRTQKPEGEKEEAIKEKETTQDEKFEKDTTKPEVKEKLGKGKKEKKKIIRKRLARRACKSNSLHETRRNRAVISYRLLDAGKVNLEDAKPAKFETNKPVPKRKYNVKTIPKAKVFKENEGSSFKEKLKELSAKRREELANKAGDKESPSKSEDPPEVLNQSQAEYAVSALFNYTSNASEIDVDEEDDVKQIKKRRKVKRFQPRPIRKGTWSQERFEMYKNRKKRKHDTRTKAERELSRLGHVVINMSQKPVTPEVEDSDSSFEISHCKKAFCKLGCVCPSLSVPMREEFHCGKAECIFKCLCSNAGASNCLFDSRVTEKTRNLAPGEKEFINTVISKGSENMVVADRGKRERKIPQRLQNDFLTGEELETASFNLKNTGRDSIEEVCTPARKKRLLLENWNAQLVQQQSDRQSSVPSPDFLEKRCVGRVKYHYGSEDEDGNATRVYIDTIETSDITYKRKEKKKRGKGNESITNVMADATEEDVTPKIISISSIAPEEFERADKIEPVKRELEIIREVSIDSPTSFGIVEARQKAKLRAMELLPLFKESIIDAYKFKPGMLTYNKFCIVDWSSFVDRFYNRDLLVWVEKDVTSMHKIAIITKDKKEPYPNLIDVWDMADAKLPQEKTFDNLNLNRGSPKCPFILWCNGSYWEILGKLSNTQKQTNQMRLLPEPIDITELPVEDIESKWFSIPATLSNSFEKLEVKSEKFIINYLAICKMLNVTWRTKNSFVAKIQKISGPHVHNAPLGFYSIPSKTRIFLGPFRKQEYPLVKLIPYPGNNSSGHIECVILSKKGNGSTFTRSLQRPSPVLVSEKSVSTPEKKLPSNRFWSEVEDADVSEQGFWTCNREDVQDVPFITLYNDKVKIRHQLDSQNLIFESAKGVARFLDYVYQDTFDKDVTWTTRPIMSKDILYDFDYLKNQQGIHISDPELNRVLGMEVNGRPVRKRSTPKRLKEDEERSSLEIALDRWESFKEEMLDTVELGSETSVEPQSLGEKIATASSSSAKVTLISSPFKETSAGKLLKTVLADSASLDISIVKKNAPSEVPPVVNLADSPVKVDDGLDQDSEAMKREEDLLQLKQQIKEAFQVAGNLYPAFEDGKHSRSFLLQRMNNEIELLKLQEKALNDAMEEAKLEKSKIFKKFSSLPKKDRKNILLAIRKLNNPATEEEPPKKKMKDGSGDTELQKLVSEQAPQEPAYVKATQEPAYVKATQEPASVKATQEPSASSSPNHSFSGLHAVSEPTITPSGPVVKIVKHSATSKIYKLSGPLMRQIPQKLAVPKLNVAHPATVSTSNGSSKTTMIKTFECKQGNQIIRFVSTNKPGEFIRLNNLIATSSGNVANVGIIRPSLAIKSTFMHVGGSAIISSTACSSATISTATVSSPLPTVGSPLPTAAQINVPNLKQVDAQIPALSIKASVPWVKCISSTGITSDDKMKIAKDKNVTLNTLLSAKPAASAANAATNQKTNNTDGMPRLIHCNLNQVQSSHHGLVNSEPPSLTSNEGVLSRRRKLTSSYTAAAFEMAVHSIVEEGSPVFRAAQKYGIPSRTLYNYLKKTNERAKNELYDEVDICSQSSSGSSVEMLDSPKA